MVGCQLVVSRRDQMVFSVDTWLLSVNANGDLPLANGRASRRHATDVICQGQQCSTDMFASVLG